MNGCRARSGLPNRPVAVVGLPRRAEGEDA